MTFLVRDPQKEHQKLSRNQRMHETQKKKAPRIDYACTVNLLNDRIIVNGELVTLWKLGGCGLF